MIFLLYFFCAVAAVLIVVVLFSCARISGDCSRREEWQDESQGREKYLN